VKREDRRERLRNRRASVCFPFTAQSLKFTGSYSRFDDGRIAEIFITNHKAGSSAGILANEAAIAASFAMQHGCLAELIARALPRDGNGVALGPLGAALDFISKDRDDA
jgi:hypothetical protein